MTEVKKCPTYKEFTEKIVELQSDVDLFKVEFLDRDGFKRFADDLVTQTGDFHEIRVTGYFSETIREALERLVKKHGVFSVKLISPEFSIQSKRDQRSLEVLEKLAKAGVEIKLNHRLHARFLVASFRTRASGLLILGSFDFNTECIGKERYDAGIKTSHPDLVKSAEELFEHIWSEPASAPLEEFIKKAKRR